VIGPEPVYRPALEDSDEEEGTTSDNRSQHGQIEDPCVYALDADPEKKVSNGQLGEDHCPAVEDVAEPPAMPRFLNVLGRQVAMMSAGTIVYSNIRRYYVEDHEHLGKSDVSRYT
jgi:hypothetical protein